MRVLCGEANMGVGRGAKTREQTGGVTMRSGSSERGSKTLLANLKFPSPHPSHQTSPTRQQYVIAAYG